MRDSESKINPLSQYNAFFKLAPEKTLCGLDQLVGLHIQNLFNKAHWAETILVEDAELLKLINWYDKTGIPTSIESVRKAKARLKKKRFIDFEVTSKGTEYRLIKLYPSNTPADTPNDTPEDTSPSSYIRVREDVLDVKENSILQSTRARNFEELDDLVEFWEKQLLGGRLSIEHQSKLLFHLKEKGYTWVKEAMKESSEANINHKGLQPKFFFAVLQRKLDDEKNKVPKGNVKNDGSEEKRNYGRSSELKPPSRSGNEPWASRKREG